MTNFNINIDLEVETRASDDEFDARTDAVFEALLVCANITDADMSVGITERRVSFSVWVDAEDVSLALSVAFGAVRTAIHAEHGATPGWEDALNRARAAGSPGPALVDA